MSRMQRVHDLQPGEWLFAKVREYGVDGAVHSWDIIPRDQAVVEATHIWYCSPHGARGLLALRGRGTQANGHSWEWNESVDAPTLHPSINEGEGGWHGFLTDGKMS